MKGRRQHNRLWFRTRLPITSSSLSSSSLLFCLSSFFLPRYSLPFCCCYCFAFFFFFRLELILSICYLPAVQSFSWLQYNKRVMMETVTIYCNLLLRLFAVYLKTDEAVINHLLLVSRLCGTFLASEKIF